MRKGGEDLNGKTRQRSDHRKTWADNIRLRRENSRLKKHIQRLNGSIQVMGYDDEPKESQSIQGCSCDECGKEAKELSLGQFIYIMCTVCNYRVKRV